MEKIQAGQRNDIENRTSSAIKRESAVTGIT